MEALLAIVVSVLGTAGSALLLRAHGWRPPRAGAGARGRRRRGSASCPPPEQRIATAEPKPQAQRQLAYAQLRAPRYRPQPAPIRQNDLRPVRVIRIDGSEDTAQIEREAPPHVRLVFLEQQARPSSRAVGARAD